VVDGPELEYGLTDSGTMIAIADGERWERLREHVDNCPALKPVYVSRSTEEIADPRVGKLEERHRGPNELGNDGAGRPAVGAARSRKMMSTIFYTSGTTGKPKGAVITHRNVISNFFNAMCAQARSFLRRGEPLPTPDPTIQKANLISVPFFHATGCFAVMIPAVMGGSKLVMQRRWNADQALELIERERHHAGRRRADDCLADHRASALPRVRPLVARDDLVWWRALRAGARATA
jgi:long-chain acyl-CoA synthetase